VGQGGRGGAGGGGGGGGGGDRVIEHWAERSGRLTAGVIRVVGVVIAIIGAIGLVLTRRAPPPQKVRETARALSDV